MRGCRPAPAPTAALEALEAATLYSGAPLLGTPAPAPASAPAPAAAPAPLDTNPSLPPPVTPVPGAPQPISAQRGAGAGSGAPWPQPPPTVTAISSQPAASSAVLQQLGEACYKRGMGALRQAAKHPGATGTTTHAVNEEFCGAVVHFEFAIDQLLREPLPALLNALPNRRRTQRKLLMFKGAALRQLRDFVAARETYLAARELASGPRERAPVEAKLEEIERLIAEAQPLTAAPSSDGSSSTALFYGGTVTAAAASSDVRSLPPEWKSAKDCEGKTYFYNVSTRERSWTHPDSRHGRHSSGRRSRSRSRSRSKRPAACRGRSRSRSKERHSRSRSRSRCRSRGRRSHDRYERQSQHGDFCFHRQ